MFVVRRYMALCTFPKLSIIHPGEIHLLILLNEDDIQYIYFKN